MRCLSWIFRIITPVFSVTWSFRKDPQILLTAQKKKSYQCSKQSCWLICLWKPWNIFKDLFFLNLKVWVNPPQYMATFVSSGLTHKRTSPGLSSCLSSLSDLCLCHARLVLVSMRSLSLCSKYQQVFHLLKTGCHVAEKYPKTLPWCLDLSRFPRRLQLFSLISWYKHDADQ